MTQTRLSPLAWAELALLGLIWGGSFLAIRTALDDVSVLASVTHRVLWATLILWAVVAVRRLPVPRNPRVWGAFLVMGLLNNVIPFTLMAWGQLTIETGLTAILNAATAIWGVLVASVVFADERLSARRLTGVLTGFAGVALAIGPAALLSFDIRSLAQLAVLAGTLSYAIAGSWARATLADHPPLVSAAGMLTGSTAVMLTLTLSIEGGLPLALPADTWLAIGYYSVAATAFAYLLYYRILARAGAGNLMLVTLLIPPIAIGLGIWARDEPIAPNTLAGFALLAAGLLILNKAPKPARR